VLRAHLTDEKRCYLHPHRVVRTACARCKTPYCDECLQTRDDGLFAQIVAQDEKRPAPLFCARCIDEVEALAVLKSEQKLHRRLRPTRERVRRAAIWVAVIAVVLVPMSVAVRTLAETTLTPEELGRIRLALSGGFQSQDGINFLSQPFGGTFVRASAPSQPNHQPDRLLDTWATEDVPGWRSAGTQLPVELVFQLPQRLKITSLVVRPQPAEPTATWVRDFEVLVSEESAESGFRRVAGGTQGTTAVGTPVPGQAPGMGAGQGGTKIEFDEVNARYVMLRVLSNHGSAEYTSLGEVEVYWAPPQRR
jgi:hypothetical protein